MTGCWRRSSGSRRCTTRGSCRSASAGVLQGIVFFTTPPVGGHLAARPARARAPAAAWTKPCAIARELLEALVYAHGRDVRHGDLRPKHVLLGRTGIAVASLRAGGGARRRRGGQRGQHRGHHRRARRISRPSSSPARPRPTSAAISTASAASSSRCSPASRRSAAATSRRCSAASSPRRRRRSARSATASRPRSTRFVARCLARLPADRFQQRREAREALQAAR